MGSLLEEAESCLVEESRQEEEMEVRLEGEMVGRLGEGREVQGRLGRLGVVAWAFLVHRVLNMLDVAHKTG